MVAHVLFQKAQIRSMDVQAVKATNEYFQTTRLVVSVYLRKGWEI